MFIDLPEGFDYVEDNRIIASIAYVTHDNFIGRPIPGYEASRIILSKEAHKALLKVQDSLDELEAGYHLKVFDAYRPERAVQQFHFWAQDDQDSLGKARYYPTLTKSELFTQGYIARPSSHSRGSTVDLTITYVHPKTGQTEDLDMGTCFDFFGEQSHTFSESITELQMENRGLLLYLMENQGFINLEQEWWHYTLRDEPFGDQYFDFPVR